MGDQDKGLKGERTERMQALEHLDVAVETEDKCYDILKE